MRITNSTWTLDQIRDLPVGPIDVPVYSHPLIRFILPYKRSTDKPCINCRCYFHVTKDSSEDEEEWVHGFLCQRSFEDSKTYIPVRFCLTCAFGHTPKYL